VRNSSKPVGYCQEDDAKLQQNNLGSELLRTYVACNEHAEIERPDCTDVEDTALRALCKPWTDPVKRILAEELNALHAVRSKEIAPVEPDNYDHLEKKTSRRGETDTS